MQSARRGPRTSVQGGPRVSATNQGLGDSFLAVVLLSRVEGRHKNADVTQCVDPGCPLRNDLGTSVRWASEPGKTRLFPEKWLIFALTRTGSGALFCISGCWVWGQSWSSS